MQKAASVLRIDRLNKLVSLWIETLPVRVRPRAKKAIQKLTEDAKFIVWTEKGFRIFK